MQEKSILFPNFAHFHFQTLRHFATKLCDIWELGAFLIGNLVQFQSPSWRIFNHRVGAILFGHLAEFYLERWRSFVWEFGGKYVNFMLIITFWSKMTEKFVSIIFFSYLCRRKGFCALQYNYDKKIILTFCCCTLLRKHVGDRRRT